MMEPRRRLSSASRFVLTHLVNHQFSGCYGRQLCNLTKLQSGTVYPILDRFIDYGWIVASDEQGDPSKLGRPLRTYYHITDAGLAAAADHLKDQT